MQNGPHCGFHLYSNPASAALHPRACRASRVCFPCGGLGLPVWFSLHLFLSSLVMCRLLHPSVHTPRVSVSRSSSIPASHFWTESGLPTSTPDPAARAPRPSVNASVTVAADHARFLEIICGLRAPDFIMLWLF